MRHSSANRIALSCWVSFQCTEKERAAICPWQLLYMLQSVQLMEYFLGQICIDVYGMILKDR